MLVIHGEKGESFFLSLSFPLPLTYIPPDDRIPLKESQDFVRANKATLPNLQLVVLENEDHGLHSLTDQGTLELYLHRLLYEMK